MKRPTLIGTCNEEKTRLSIKTKINDSNPAWIESARQKTFVRLLFVYFFISSVSKAPNLLKIWACFTQF